MGGNIDLAIVDVDLSNEDGAEVIKELRAVGVPVLALTLGQSLQGRARAVRAGAAEVGLTRLRGPIRVKRSGSVKGVEDGQDRQALLA